jgi:hypothetical protein
MRIEPGSDQQQAALFLAVRRLRTNLQTHKYFDRRYEIGALKSINELLRLRPRSIQQAKSRASAPSLKRLFSPIGLPFSSQSTTWPSAT